MPTALQLKRAWFQFRSCLPARPPPATCCNTWRPKGFHVWTLRWWMNPDDCWSASQSCTVTCHYSLCSAASAMSVIRESEWWALMCPQSFILCNLNILSSQVIIIFFYSSSLVIVLQVPLSTHSLLLLLFWTEFQQIQLLQGCNFSRELISLFYTFWAFN